MRNFLKIICFFVLALPACIPTSAKPANDDFKSYSRVDLADLKSISFSSMSLACGVMTDSRAICWGTGLTKEISDWVRSQNYDVKKVVLLQSDFGYLCVLANSGKLSCYNSEVLPELRSESWDDVVMAKYDQFCGLRGATLKCFKVWNKDVSTFHFSKTPSKFFRASRGLCGIIEGKFECAEGSKFSISVDGKEQIAVDAAGDFYRSGISYLNCAIVDTKRASEVWCSDQSGKTVVVDSLEGEKYEAIAVVDSTYVCALNSGTVYCWSHFGNDFSKKYSYMTDARELWVDGFAICATHNTNQTSCVMHNPSQDPEDTYNHLNPWDFKGLNSFSIGNNLIINSTRDFTLDYYLREQSSLSHIWPHIEEASKVTGNNYYYCAHFIDRIECHHQYYLWAKSHVTLPADTPYSSFGSFLCYASGAEVKCEDFTKREPTKTFSPRIGAIQNLVGGGSMLCMKGDRSWSCVDQKGPINMPLSMELSQDLQAGSDFFCGITKGKVNCWSPTNSEYIRNVPQLNDVKSLRVGYNVSCALSSSGQASCWGLGGKSFEAPSSWGQVLDVQVSRGETDNQRACFRTDLGFGCLIDHRTYKGVSWIPTN